MTNDEMQRLLDLPPEKRLELSDALRRGVVSEEIEIPEWHRPLIDEAVAELEENPDAASPWQEVLARVRARLSKRA
jgi:hypothetical protein